MRPFCLFNDERVLVSVLAVVLLVVTGCATTQGTPAIPVKPIKVVVGPMILEAPITKPTQIHSFEEDPAPEQSEALLEQLKDEIEVTAQQYLTESLAKQPAFQVVPFDEAVRIQTQIAPPRSPLTPEQIKELGRLSSSDFVVTGLIHDYGKVRWQYWATGWLLHVAAWTVVLGTTTAWNPAALGAFYAIDATTDFPIWWGGAEIFGFAFRPVRTHVDVTQYSHCIGEIWTGEELAVRVPGKTLEEYPPEARRKKETQLEANLKRTIDDIVEEGKELRLQPCNEEGQPEKADTFSILSVLDALY